MRRWINGEIAVGFLIATFFWIAVLGWATSFAPTQPEKEACYQAAAKTSHDTSECKTFWERTTSDPIATFTLVLAFSTVGLWVATIGLYFAGRGAISETRRIGEAQVRAYVEISAATITFVDAGEGVVKLGDFQPSVRITPKNTGQSTAINFVWNPTVEYISLGSEVKTMRNQLGGNWREVRGIGIFAGTERNESALVTGMMLMKFLRESGAITNFILTRLRVQFEFEDVFNQRIADEAYFSGFFTRKEGDTIATAFGITTEWKGSLSRMNNPNDWPPTN